MFFPFHIKPQRPKRRPKTKRTRKRNNRKDNRTYGEKVQDNLKYAIIRIATNPYVITFGVGLLAGVLITLYMIKDIIG